ncbi:hypothetical protein [Asticcacaulis tiandongensis]|uniref:hypothetical protein n=1 Tax=Asticcacaulis tiandongensis TaxID=2565365 RepID=UPI00112A1515|nr:hypothetical protein [Asticcacaulis tiandongensis]
MDFLPIAIFWLLALIGLFSRKPQFLLYLFFASMSFGAFAVIPTNLTGGLTFTATPMVALLIIARTLGNDKGFAYLYQTLLAPRGFLLLCLFWVIAVIVTLFMPRLFAGEVEIIPMRLTLFMRTDMLQPTTQNISQLAYLTISIAAVPAFARLMSTEAMRQQTLKALCFGGAIVIGTGLLDFLSQYMPLKPVLAPFRTATYALLTEVDIAGGTKRVVGLMPEASAYGALCISFLTGIYFFRRAMISERLRQFLVPALLGLLLIFTWLSTSSAAYVALVVLGGAMGAEWLWRAIQKRHRGLKRDLGLEMAIAFAVIIGLCLIFLFSPRLFDPIIALFNEMVLKKSSTSSFEERSMWTAISWQALLDTYGLGVGMGGTRASNSVVAVFSSTGFLGGLCYYGFVLQTILRRAASNDDTGAALLNAVRWSLLPGLVTGLLIGTTADFGAFNAWLYGLAAAAAFAAYGVRPGLSPKTGFRPKK